jgi:hypothetical protein
MANRDIPTHSSWAAPTHNEDLAISRDMAADLLHCSTKETNLIAYIDDIKALPRPDQRKLVLISWIYLYDGRYYGSNHLQIVLWDTVAGRADKKQVQETRHDQLYNACGGVKLCGKKQADVWQ